MKITFDVDGVLNDITGYLMRKINAEKEFKYYYITENSEFTDAEKESILKGYDKLDTFVNAGFVSDAKRILEIKEEDLYIYTYSNTKEILDFKRQELIKMGINPDHITDAIYTHDLEKNVVTDILVEDCLKNIITSNVKVKSIIIDKSYNKAETYGYTDEELNIKRVSSVSEAVDYIKECRLWM